MSTAGYDVIVVGAGPAGSIAALVLARAGARVALVDKATNGRDKACGDLIGPRGVQLLDDLGIDVGPSDASAPMIAGDMLVTGPSGRRVLLPARAGRTYPGHAIVVPRREFDARLRTAALDVGALGISRRVASAGQVQGQGQVVLDDGSVLHANTVIGADGATSITARTAGMVDRARALWGFAVRGYIPVDVPLPVIALWNERPRHAFPGYGWLFPGPGGANLGLGIGLGADRHHSHRAQQQLDSFRTHLVRIGILDTSVGSPVRQLGGWLKMGLVGTRPTTGNVLLVGDAAGLVNPLQGEGIAQAMASGRAAAEAVLARPARSAEMYREWIDHTYGSFASVTSPVHAGLVGHPRRIAVLAAALTAPGIGRCIASTWALYWNDLADGAADAPAATAARVVHRLGAIATARSRVRRELVAGLHDSA